MGCVVNGTGECEASEPRDFFARASKEPKAPVYVDGRLFTTLKGESNRLLRRCIKIPLDDYVESHYAVPEKKELAREDKPPIPVV